MPAPMPTLGEVLYTEPNPNKSRKQCGNCFLWKSASDTCVIHDEDVIVISTMVCGYHVFGPSLTLATDVMPALANIMSVDPEMSNLQNTVQGASCDLCEWFTPRGQMEGVCRGTVDREGAGLHPTEAGFHPVVSALGCCSRFAKREE
jgi:hypothetical protein